MFNKRGCCVFLSGTLDFFECKMSLIHVEVETRGTFKNTYKIILRYFLVFLRLMCSVCKSLVNQGIVGICGVALKTIKK